MTGVEDAKNLMVIRPRLAEQEAARKLILRSLMPPFQKIGMEKVEVCYLPHYLFTIKLQWKRDVTAVDAAVDALLGHFAHWEQKGLNMEVAKEGGGEIPFSLSREAAEQKLREQYRWTLITSAMKTRKRFEIQEIIAGPRVYYPFWTGYYRVRGKWRFEVLDAVSGMRQGGKVRDALLMAWMKK